MKNVHIDAQVDISPNAADIYIIAFLDDNFVMILEISEDVQMFRMFVK